MAVELRGDSVALNLETDRPAVVDYFRALPEERRDVTALDALEMGAMMLERAQQHRDLDFIERRIGNVLAHVEASVRAIPETVQQQLLRAVGTGDGQVLAPIREATTEVQRVLLERVREVRELTSDLDPTKETSVVRKVVGPLSDLLDAKRTDSIPALVQAMVNGVVTEDGPLAKSVKITVADAVKPLVDQVDRLGKELHAREKLAEVLQETIAKGTAYEEQVCQQLLEWGRHNDAEVEHIGGDRKPGDLLVTVDMPTGERVSIVIETRDQGSPTGRKGIANCLAEAMNARRAIAAIYLSKTIEGLGKDVGAWAQGTCAQGPWIATTQSDLCTALRRLLANLEVRYLRAARPTLDIAAIEAQLTRVDSALGRITNVTRKCTDIQGAADEIKKEGRLLREEVQDALDRVDAAIRKIAGDDEAQLAAAS